MKLLIWFLTLFVLATGLSLLVEHNTGYALLFIPPWRIELSLNAFVLIFFALLLGGYTLIRGFDWVVLMPIKVRQYRQARRAAVARKQRTEALMAMLEGRYQLAERAIRRTAEAEQDSEALCADRLIGAYVSHHCRDYTRRDRYLEQVRETTLGKSLALAMLEAELLYGQFRNREALEALERALSLSPRLTSALKLELKIRQQEKHPARILELTDQLERSEALDPAQAARIRAQARLMQLAQESMDATELRRWWQSLSTAEKLHPVLAAKAAKALALAGEDAEAEAIIVTVLEHFWDAALVDAYGLLGQHARQTDAAIQRLGRAESWLQYHADDHVLLLALGRLCIAGALWGKARTYLEASIAVHPTPVALAELGQLQEQLGDLEAAAASYRRSLALALDTLDQGA